MSQINDAVRVLQAGGLVAFPTETVYGLGADARSAPAVRRIFEVKGRPATNPLIVHVLDEKMAQQYVLWNHLAGELARAFWPGPLTLVLLKGKSIPGEVSAHRYSVGVRAPDHPIATELLQKFAGPIAAPSANRSNRISPTTAAHVREEFGEDVEIILDGGPARVGIESTVLDLTCELPRILRPGAVTREQLEEVAGTVEMRPITVDASLAAESPGQQARHYSPLSPAYRGGRVEIEEMLRQPHPQGRRVAILFAGEAVDASVEEPVLELPRDPSGYAQSLYSTLRKADAMRPACILIELPPEQPAWAAVRDRVMRATLPWAGE